MSAEHTAIQDAKDHAGASLEGLPAPRGTPVRASFLWIHAMRVIAAILVVMGHANAGILLRWNTIPASHWWTTNIFAAFLRVSALLFFVLSGWLLLGKTEPVAIFFKRRFAKILVPLIVWSCVYVLWRKYYDGEPLALPKSLLLMLGGPVKIHLWFMYSLIALYLITPILRIIVQHGGRTMIQYMIGMWFLTFSIVPIVDALSATHLGIDLKFFGGFMGLYLLGQLIGGKEFSTKETALWALGAIAGAAVTTVGTYLMTARNDAYFGSFNANEAPNIIFTTICVFFVLKWVTMHAEKLPQFAKSCIKELSTLTYGIYLIHVLVLDLLRDGYFPITLSGKMGHPIWAVPLTGLAGFAISSAIVFILGRVPYVRAAVR